MPTIPPVNTQQVLSMGTHAEQLQQSIQNQGSLLASHLDQERQAEDELTRAGVQYPDESSPSIEIRGDGRRGDARRGSRQKNEEEEGSGSADHPACPESGLGLRIDLTV